MDTDYKHQTSRCKNDLLEKKMKLILLEFFSLIPENEIGLNIDDSEFDPNSIKSSKESFQGGLSEFENVKRKLSKQNAVDDSYLLSNDTTSTTEESVKEKKRLEKSNTVHSSQPSIGHDSKSNSSVKFHTIAVSESERKQLMDQLAVHMKTESGKLVVRSKSYETRAYYLAMRNKMQKMLVPLQDSINEESIEKGLRDLDEKLKNDDTIDSHNRFSVILDSVKPTSCKCRKKKKPRPPNLKIPKRRNLKRNGTLKTANLIHVVDELEYISRDISDKFPNIYSEYVSTLLTPLKDQKNIPYALFETLAYALFHTELEGFVTSIMHRISLVMSFTKRTMVVGNLDDEMMEVMVDHSTKFLNENVLNTLEAHGGWDSLDGADEHTASSEEECKSSCKYAHTSYQQTITNWIPFAIAVLAVGVGLAYSLR